ncbi:MAG: hypothetical protein LLF94_05630 [Chlamydiales bacterium]|nr:hypothetical protein [Chlamydiales bacterium]
MNVSLLSGVGKEIFDCRSNTWAQKLKECSAETIVSIIKTISSNADDRVWKFAGRALNELSIRSWAKKHPEELEGFRDLFCELSRMCFACTAYGAETAGLVTKNKKIHPHPEKTKKIEKKWSESETKSSLESFISDSSSLKSLKDQSVTYLRSKERKNYNVTFSDRGILVGGIEPEDGSYIFALGKDKKKKMLLVGKKVRGAFHHTSFFAGAPVFCPGNMTIQKRQIVKIKLSSGHYKPQAKQEKVLREFLSLPNNLGQAAVGLVIESKKIK